MADSNPCYSTVFRFSPAIAGNYPRFVFPAIAGIFPRFNLGIVPGVNTSVSITLFVLVFGGVVDSATDCIQ